MIDWPITLGGFTTSLLKSLGVRATISAGEAAAGGLLSIGRHKWNVRNANTEEVARIRDKCGEYTSSAHVPRPIEESYELSLIHI